MKSAPQFFRHGPSQLARLFFFVLLSLLLMAEDTRFKYFPEIRQTVAIIIYPLQQIAYIPARIYIRVDEFLASLHLLDENTYLKQRHISDRNQILQLRALEAENTHLRKLLGAVQRTKIKAIMAEILHVPRDPFNHKATLNKGSRDGIQLGQVVVDDMGVIGQITQIYPWASEITLITDKDHSVPIQVVRSGLRSVVSGAGKNDELEIRYLSVNTDIQSGDLLVTSGIDGVYPSGLPVAEVSRIERNPSNPFAYIICQPIAGVNRNRQVLILAAMPSPLENPSEVSQTEAENIQKGKDSVKPLP
ncbi:MAG: rod shape-determining protein MreC [Nitrosomonas sp.]|nr:rod shape-determining protein MreC [Nitrosomonas sp.]